VGLYSVLEGDGRAPGSVGVALIEIQGYHFLCWCGLGRLDVGFGRRILCMLLSGSCKAQDSKKS
jgi:hypothetical protein